MEYTPTSLSNQYRLVNSSLVLQQLLPAGLALNSTPEQLNHNLNVDCQV